MKTDTAVAQFYSFKADTIDGKEISLSEFAGKVVLVVNVASKCGFTPQYTGLQELYEKYRDEGFVVLGFPCNQFGGQEPGTEQEINDGCVADFHITFPMFAKVDVNGKNAHPLYVYLKKAIPGFLGGRIKWNFTKFLIDCDGTPVMRFASTDTPEAIEKHIRKLLSQ